MDYRIIIGSAPDIRGVNPNLIINSACKHFKTNLNDFLSRERTTEKVFARRVCMYLIKNNCIMSNANIASMFSPAITKNDHTAVSYTLKAIYANYDYYKKDIEAITFRVFYSFINNALHT